MISIKISAIIHIRQKLYLHFSYHHVLEEIVEVVEHIEEALDIE